MEKFIPNQNLLCYSIDFIFNWEAEMSRKMALCEHCKGEWWIYECIRAHTIKAAIKISITLKHNQTIGMQICFYWHWIKSEKKNPFHRVVEKKELKTSEQQTKKKSCDIYIYK